MLLWGDEVRWRLMIFAAFIHIKCVNQIEYLVVSFDDKDRKVRLSLRQADILTALANNKDLVKQGGGVPEVQTVKKR